LHRGAVFASLKFDVPADASLSFLMLRAVVRAFCTPDDTPANASQPFD
jgi:hypothetical protein